MAIFSHYKKINVFFKKNSINGFHAKDFKKWLNENNKIKNFIVRVVFDTPYARRLYWHPEYNFRKDKNPNAQGKWMESYLTGENQQFIRDTYAKFLKMLSKGLVK